MSKVIKERYAIPKFSRGGSSKDSLELIQRSFYGSDFECLSMKEVNKLVENIKTYGPELPMDTFCKVYNCYDLKDFVEVLAKYYGVCFNSVSFSTQEDILIRAYYPIFGKFTNLIVADILTHNLRVDDYVTKSEREIQDRVDYLQRGYNYNGFYRDVKPNNFNSLVSKKSDALVCVDIPKNRPSYTVAEHILLKLTDTYGLNFIPWKDNNEVEYYLSDKQDKVKYEAKCLNFNFSRENVYLYFLYNCRAGLTVLLNKKAMGTYDPEWNSYMDELLKDCVKNIDPSLDLNTQEALNILYRPLIKKGKSVVECNARIHALGISMGYTSSEIKALLDNTTMTFEQQSRHKKGFSRTAFSMGNKVMSIENKYGCKVSNMTEEMKEEIISDYFN